MPKMGEIGDFWAPKSALFNFNLDLFVTFF